MCEGPVMNRAFLFGRLMLDSNWDLINGPVAHEIEVLNYANQINVMEALVRYFTHHAPPTEGGCPITPNSNALREIHRTGTLFLLETPGEYRQSEVVVAKPDAIVHEPPTFSEIPGLMEGFDLELAGMWGVSSPIEIAAWALWRINYIHPFKNGNGRAARAFSYACLCLKYGFMLPGSPTVIDLVMASRPQFEEALGVADKAFRSTGVADLEAMEIFLEQLVIRQLTSLTQTANEPAVANDPDDQDAAKGGSAP